ncbi:hypothetical protein RUND412_010674 [Rhizina undulata]
MSALRYTFLRLMLSSFLSSAIAKPLFVGSYSGNITALNFDGTGFTTVGVYSGSAPNPSWQSLVGNILYSVSENWSTDPGVIHSYKVGDNGETLDAINTAEGLPAPVHIAVTSNRSLLIVANYDGSGVSTFTSAEGVLTAKDTFPYTLATPGPDADRQSTPHPHQVLVDNSGSFALIPDLGADLIRVFGISGTNVTQKTAISVPTGSGPRHGAFWPKGASHATHFYLISELVNEITTFEVAYSDDDILLTPVSTVSTYGPTATTPSVSPTPSVGEIGISHDDKFLYVTNRGDKTFNTSDSLSSWKIDPSSGSLEFLELSPAGGLGPRHFALDREGEYITIACQDSNTISVFPRNSTTGLVEHTPVAEVDINGGPVCVTWVE